MVEVCSIIVRNAPGMQKVVDIIIVVIGPFWPGHKR